MKTKLIRLGVVVLTFAALARMGVTSSSAQSSGSSSSGSGGMGGCCGQQKPQEATSCPSGQTYDDSKKVCVDSSGTPRSAPK